MKIYKFLFLIIISCFAFSLFSNDIYAIKEEKIDQTIYNNYEERDNGFKSCGKVDGKNAIIEDIPPSVPKIVHIVYLAIWIAIPIVLVVFGSIDLIKGVIAQKEDEIKKGQQTFIKRLIAAAIIFMVFMIVKLVVGAVADSNKNQIIKCAECFIENNCD